MSKKIIIDVMGADNGIDVFVKGATLALKDFPDYEAVFVGHKDTIEKAIKDNNYPYCNIIDTDEIFLNTDSPMDLAVGDSKDNTSLVRGLKALREDDNNVAMISAGSTGGFLVGSITKLGLIQGIKYPALASPMINIHEKWFALLDCGANLDVDTKSMLNFAKMGTALMKSAFGNIENPRVGLLNVGKEETKGNKLTKETYQALKETSLNFIGNIEGHEIYLDKADVIVCDGFVGNVFLKGAEALSMVIEKIVSHFGKDDPNIQAACKYIHKNFNYNEEGAAVFLGPKKICLKAHGHATEHTIYSAIKFAVMLDKGQFIDNLNRELHK